MRTVDPVVVGTVSSQKEYQVRSLLQISHRDPCDQTHGLSHHIENGGGMHTTYRTLEA